MYHYAARIRDLKQMGSFDLLSSLLTIFISLSRCDDLLRVAINFTPRRFVYMIHGHGTDCDVRRPNVTVKTQGTGKWTIVNIERCEEDDLFSFKMDVDVHRVNRSHVAFSFNLHIDKDIDDSVSIRIDVCKYVDGGCKPYQTLVDESAIRFSEKYAKKNVDAGMSMADIENWPIAKGDYAVNDYIFNLDELPKKSLYGDFIAKGYLLTGMVEFACVKVAAKFEKHDDEDEDDDD